MARFLTAPRRQMVNPYPEVNVDFYSNLMGQAQQNLNQATQMQAGAMEQAYNLPFTSQEDYEAIVTPMKEKFEGMLDKEFVSPSEIARTIMDTRGEMQPRISALQNKAKELQMQRQFQTEWGLDWMGNDVSKMSITDTDPSQIRGVNFNRGQIRNAFIQSKGAEFLKETDSGRYQKLEGFPGDNMYGRVVTSGLNDQQKAMYAPGTELAVQNANEYFNSLPDNAKKDLIAITGSPEAALQTIQQTQYEAVNDPKFAYSQKVVGATQYTPSTEENTFSPKFGRMNNVVDLEEYDSKTKESETYSEMSRILKGNSSIETQAKNIWYDFLDQEEKYIDKESVKSQVAPLIKENKELFKKVSEQLSQNTELDNLNFEDKKEIVYASFLEELARIRKEESAKGVLSVTYSPTEMVKLAPDLKAKILPKLSQIEGEDITKEDIFNGASFNLIPSKGLIRVNTSLEDTPYLDISLKDLDTGLGILGDFISNVSTISKKSSSGADDSFVYLNAPRVEELSTYIKNIDKKENSYINGIKAVRKEKDGLYEYLLDSEGNIQTYKGTPLKTKVSMQDYYEELVSNFEETFSKSK